MLGPLRSAARLGAGVATVGLAGAGFTAGLVKGTATVLPSAARALPRAATAVLPERPAREAAGAAKALTDVHPRRQRRRVWVRPGRAHIEVRGLDGARRRQLAESVPRALGRLQGVNWARVNDVTGEVLVAFDDGSVGVDSLLDAVRAVEGANRVRDDDFSWSRPIHPGDGAPIAAAAVALAADCVAFTAASAQAVFRFSPLPRQARAALAVLDVERSIRSGVKRRIGPIETDLVLALANAAVHGLSQGVSAPAVDAVCRVLQLNEVWERRRVWRLREPELAGSADAVPQDVPAPPPRPGKRPRGPIETWNDRLGPLGPAVAAIVLALTRDTGRAADAFTATAPRAARYGREGFATAVGRDLARRGIVPLNAAAFRRLDRISAIIVDVDVLTDGEEGLSSLADAVLEAAAGTGATVLLAGRDPADQLVARADQTLDPDVPIADHVRNLQDDGHGVLVISTRDGDGLAAADVAVAISAAGSSVYWSADLVCGSDLEHVWRVLRATSAARGVSTNAVRLAQAGSALGALIALVGARRRWFQIGPVQLAGFVAMGYGVAAGLRATRAGAPQHVVTVPWHELPATEVYRRLQRDLDRDAGDGDAEQSRWPVALATAADVVRRPLRDTAGLLSAVTEELRDPLTPVLGVGAVASAIVGSPADGILVAAVLAGNALISGFQRVRAERALRELLFGQQVWARRVRAHGLDDLPAAEVDDVRANALAPGDIIELTASEQVPADARIVAATDLEVDESSLTGESLPVAKTTEPTPGAPVAERSGMVFEGTSVLAGSGYAVVVATGSGTEAGRAARLAGGPPRAVGVQARLRDVTRVALPVTAAGGAAVTALGLMRGMPLRQAVAAGVSVAVAAVPEGLPLVATVAQAGGARRLSAQGTLVRSSRTLEALGRVDVVCFDKTGTLTEGRLQLARLATVHGDLDITSADGQRLLAAAARACPDVAADELDTVPHATDRAVLAAAVESGDPHRDGWRLITEQPFEASRGYAAALGETDAGARLVVKGAPEIVLPRCREEPDATAVVERLAGDGLRVLAVAERVDVDRDVSELDTVVSELSLLGFVGIADIARPDAPEAVRELSEAGVRVVMLTGDHPVTARAVADATGIANGSVLTGAELQGMTVDERARRSSECTVFARVSPEHKVQIVAALQRAGNVVAMIGDGINDAAAIRRADVGVGIGADRSATARSAADLVLANGDIRNVHHALYEGRAMWRRVRDAVSILVGGNAGEVAFMVIGTALGGRAPISMRQMLLVNMLTDMAPALAVALAPSNGRNDDRRPVGQVLGRPLAEAVAIRGAGTALGATLAWLAGRFTGRARRAGTMGLAALVTTQLAQTMLTGRHSMLVVGTSLASFAALVAFVQLPVISQLMGGTPLGPMAWAIVLAAAAAGTAASVVTSRSSARRAVSG